MRFTGYPVRGVQHTLPPAVTTSSPTANQKHTPGSADCTAKSTRQSEAAISSVNISEITHSI